MKTKLLSLFLIVIINTVSAQSIIYVDVNATGANNGGSWNDAFTDLQTAMTLGPALNRDVWVAAGTYVPSTSSRSIAFTITSNLTMYGGFNGTETTLAERDVQANPTILSGDIAGNDNSNILNTEPTRSENSYNVLEYAGAITGVHIDGFTISGGNANGSTTKQKRGAAIYSENASNGVVTSLNFWNCTIEKNSATDSAVYYHDLTSGVTSTTNQISFNSCIIRNNYSDKNSNVLLVGNRHFNLFSRVAFTGCLVYDNVSIDYASFLRVWSSSYGGAVGGSAIFFIKNCTITENSGANNAAIEVSNGFGNSCQLYNSILYNNGSTAPIVYVPSASAPYAITGGNYMFTDPLFVDAVSDDFRISSGSFAVDSGDNDKVPGFLTTDLSGNVRIFNSTVDMGAYEYNSTLGLDNVEAMSSLKLYPNPTNSVLNIESNVIVKQVRIVNVLGKEILKITNKTIDVSQLSQGVYLIEIKGNNNQTIIKRFIKK